MAFELLAGGVLAFLFAHLIEGADAFDPWVRSLPCTCRSSLERWVIGKRPIYWKSRRDSIPLDDLT